MCGWTITSTSLASRIVRNALPACSDVYTRVPAEGAAGVLVGTGTSKYSEIVWASFHTLTLTCLAASLVPDAAVV
jgi:hypothetical protein